MGDATTIGRLRAPHSGGLRAVAAALIGLGALAAPAAAQTALPEFPTLSGRVVDEADILPDRTRVELISRLATLEAKTGDQLVVVTLRSLRGRTIEQYGVALGRHWQIGQKGKNNGVLLIVAPNERKVRIEVGYGLEGALPDAVAKYIIEQSILPHVRASDLAGGIARGADDVIRVLTGDAAEWKQRAAPFAPSVFSRVAGLPTSPGNIALGMVFAAVCLLILVVIGWAFVGAVVEFLKWIGAFPKRKRGGRDRDYVDERTFGVGSGAYSPMPSTSSITSGDFSGGGGDFGGGGASGSW
jgi:uncharacterized protein